VVVAVEVRDLVEVALRHGEHDELGDPVAATHVIGLGRIGVDEHDAQFVPVAAVDQTGAVQHRDPVAQGQPGAGLDETGVPDGDGDGDAGRDQTPAAACRQVEVVAGQEVEPGIPGPGIAGRRQIHVEAHDAQSGHVRIVADGRHRRRSSPDPPSRAGSIRPVLIWMDLEMTGLDPSVDRIVEIATLVTDDELNVVEEGPDLVVFQPDEVLATMDPFVVDMHTRSGLLGAIRSSTISLEQAGGETLSFIRKHSPEARKIPLCGNSIGTDRRFLAAYLPEIEDWLHYRSVDVSTVKELVRRWYPSVRSERPRKQGSHRALDDIRESVAELRYYRERVFLPSRPQ
jgi:oligoribonuclease